MRLPVRAITIGLSRRRRTGGINWVDYWATRTPSNLVLEVISDTQINTTWTDGTAASDGLKIYLSIDGGANYTYHSTIAYGIETKNITGLTANTTYTIKLVAYKEANESDALIICSLTNINSALIAGYKFDNLPVFENTLTDWAFQVLNYPSAQYYNGRTYIGFDGDDGDPYITYYDHNTSTWTTSVKVGDRTLIADFPHGQPSVLIDNDGYIHVMWDSHENAILYSKSTNIEDITEWTSMGSPANGSYNQMLQFSDDTLYIFYRLAGAGYHWGFKTSIDGGANWSAFTEIMTGAAYIVVREGIGDTIHCSINGDNTTGYDRYNIYYMYFDGNIWKNKAGITLTLPITTPWTNILAYDSDINYVPMTAIGTDNINNPYILFTEGTGDGVGVYTYKILKYVNGVWTTYNIGITTDHFNEYASGLDVISATDLDVYLTTGGIADNIGGNIEKWSSKDGGLTWGRAKRIYYGQFTNPIIVKDYHVNGKVIWVNYRNSGTFIGNGYLYGDNGFISNAALSLMPSLVQDIRNIYPGLISGTLATTTGKYNQCYIFPSSGDNKIRILDDNIFSFNNGATDLPFSITFWLNMVGITGTQFVFGKRLTASQAEYWIDLTSNTIRILLSDPDVTKAIYATAPFITIGSWVFITITYTPNLTPQETGVKIYKDCLSAETAQSAIGIYTGMTNGTSDIYVGANAAGLLNLNGYMDELKIWNKVLSSEEMILEMANIL